MKGLRIGRRRTPTNELPSSPLELALFPALTDGRWQVPDRFNFTRDVVEPLAADPRRRALTFLGPDGVIEPRTFVQLAEGAARWTAVLGEREIQPGDRVLVVAGNSVDWLEVSLACIKIGAITVPCSPSSSAAALDVRVSTSGASLIVAEHASEGTIAQMSFVPDVHYLDYGERPRASDYPRTAPTHDTSSRDVALILSTSGTSSRPKDVAHTHGSLFAARVHAEHWLDAGRGDTVWCTAGTGSPQALWDILVGPWSRGAEVVLHQGAFDPLERLDLLHRLGPTILCQTPAEYRALAELQELERFQSPRLRRLVSTGDHLEPEVVAAFEERWGMTIHDGYGQSETNVIVANGAEAGFKPGSIGRPLPGHHVAVVDDQGNELPPGIEGDLALRGRPPTLFAGYWESPEETRGAFRGDWYLTGDVATVDEDGFLWFVGRAEDVIMSSGRTFGPHEIEHVLRGHAAVRQGGVVGVRDLQRGGQFVRAFVVLEARVKGSEQLEAELRHYVGQSLPEQQVPREIEFVDELPTSDGKVRRQGLRERPVSGRPLWEMPPTFQPEPLSIVPEPKPEPLSIVPEPKPEPPPIVHVPEAEPEPPIAHIPEPKPQPAPEPPLAFRADPVPEPEPEPPLIVPEPEPEPEEPPLAFRADPVPEPEPEPPLIVPEPEPEEPPLAFRADPVPEPEPEPIAASEPEPVWMPDPVREAATPTAPVAETTLAPQPEPETVLAPKPEPVVERQPDLLPDHVIEPPSDPEPAAEALPAPAPDREPEPEAQPEPKPLPDLYVEPTTTVEPIVRAASEPQLESQPQPEPQLESQPEPDLGPLPDYVVDPSRDPAAEAEAPSDTNPKPFLEIAPGPGRETHSAPPAGTAFPPMPSFPSREDTDSSDVRTSEEPRTPRTRSQTTHTSKRRERSTVEPGDEVEEVGWMRGLSNRLGAYNLAEDSARQNAEPDSDELEKTGSS